MSETLEKVEFVTTPRVETLMSEKFTKAELIEVFGSEGAIVSAASRFGMFLVSNPPNRGAIARKFHYLDALALLVFISFAKNMPKSAQKTLTKEVSALLFGESDIAPRARGAEIPTASPAKVKQLFRVHQARRNEIRDDPFRAHPIWWSRNANQNFVIFGTDDHRLMTGLFDKRDGPTIKIDHVQNFGVGLWVNATEWFARADAQLIALVERRNAARSTKADAD